MREGGQFRDWAAFSELGLEYSAVRGKGEGCTSLCLIGEGRVSISSAA